MAVHAYGEVDDSVLKGRWRVSYAMHLQYNDPDTGLNSALYERPRVDGETKYAYVLVGIETFQDWIENILQLFGLSAQYDLAVSNAEKLTQEYKHITFIRHSLGGGMAAAIAYKTGKNAMNTCL